MTDKEYFKIAYLTFYKMADNILQRYNPCKIVDGECESVRWENSLSTVDKLCGAIHNPHTLCCYDCKHHNTETGCTVQCLGCKVYLCYYLRVNGPRELRDMLDGIYAEAVKVLGHNVATVHSSLEEIMLWLAY